MRLSLTRHAGVTLDPASYLLLRTRRRRTAYSGYSVRRDEDAEGLSDWEILDVLHFRDAESTGAFQEDPNPLLLTVFGEPNPDPDYPTVSFARSTYSVAEGDTITVAVEISEAPPSAVQIPLTVTNRNGATSADYTIGVTSIFFSPQITRVNFDVTATDDAEDDDGESVRIVLGSLPEGVSRGAVDATTIQIEDNDGAAPTSGDLRLVGGLDETEGRLEIFFRGEWGTVCDDRFFDPVGDEENRAKDVACKLLGFRRGEEVTGYGQSGVSLADQPIWLDDVRCLASVPAHRVDNPRSMFDCYYAGPGLHNCTHDEDVGLRCLNSGMSTMDFTTSAASGLAVSAIDRDELQLHWSTPIGRSPLGYEVQYRTTTGQWHTWAHTTVDTTTIIHGLASATEYEVRVRATYAEGPGDWSSVTLGRATTLDAVAEGEVRLVDGSAPHEGRLEVYHDGEWGSVCDDRFTADDAAVVCRQLGYTSGEARTQATFGQGTGSVWMDDVQCTGTESLLTTCSFKGWGIHNCRNSEAVGVSCGEPAAMSLSEATWSGATLTLHFDRTLDDHSVPSPDDFVVMTETPDGIALVGVKSVAVAVGDVALVLARPFEMTETVRVSYLPAAMHPLQDTSFNPAPAFSEQLAVHTDSSTYSPIVVSTSDARSLASPANGAKVEVLDRTGQGLDDLFDLAELTDLEALYLRDNQIVDLWPLVAMQDLEYLDLRQNALSDLAPLQGLAGLRVLDVSGNAVTDVSPLATLTGLRRLDLSGNQVTDIRPLVALRDLEVLLLDGNQIADFTALRGMVNLTHLSLGEAHVADISILRDLRSLQRLDLSRNHITDVSALGTMPQLAWLRLSANPITDFFPLERLTSLRWLLLDAKTTQTGALSKNGEQRLPRLLIESANP